jgi:hypothetical protein
MSSPDTSRLQALSGRAFAIALALLIPEIILADHVNARSERRERPA